MKDASLAHPTLRSVQVLAKKPSTFKAAKLAALARQPVPEVFSIPVDLEVGLPS
jgi:hypothetical protein